jgi:hypothetical protein
MSANATVEDAETMPTSRAEASSVRTANRGIATPLTWVPSWLVAWPNRSNRKSRSAKTRDTKCLPEVWTG